MEKRGVPWWNNGRWSAPAWITNTDDTDFSVSSVSPFTTVLRGRCPTVRCRTGRTTACDTGNHPSHPAHHQRRSQEQRPYDSTHRDLVELLSTRRADCCQSWSSC